MTALPLIDDTIPALSEVEAGFGCLRGEHGPLPLKAFTAHLSIDGLCWRWAIAQEFRNVHAGVIEAVYIFPLPPRGAVSRFRLRVAGRTVEGVLQERGQARAAYQQAVRAGQRAALLEEDRPDVFTVQVGNIGPGETATVEIELCGQVAVEAGHASVRLPLVVAPRYIPGVALGDDVGAGIAGDTDAVPDASRISPPVLLPGFPNPVRLDITVDFRPGAVSAGRAGCSLPTVAEDLGGGVSRLSVRPGQRLDRDFILRWPVLGAAFAGCALATPGGDGCTVAITVAPPQAASPGTAPRMPRDVVVLLDRSGSMQGWKMVAARRAAARLVDALDRDDRFAVLAFDDSVIAPPGHGSGLRPGSDRERFAAVTWLGTIESAGGTEMNGALHQAFRVLGQPTPGRDRVLVLVTDGQVGDEDRLLRSLDADLRSTRVIALGIDQAVNESLLQRLSAPGGGWWACVESEDWLDAILIEAQRRVQPPLVSGLTVVIDGLVADGLAPSPMPDLGAGAPVTVLARCTGRPASVRVHGRLADGSLWERTIPVEGVAAPALAQCWARLRIRDLEDRYAVVADHDVAARIVALSLAENVLSRFTAFVAIDAQRREVGPARTVVQAVEQPAGWATGAGGVPGAAPVPMAPSMMFATQVGAGPIDHSSMMSSPSAPAAKPRKVGSSRAKAESAEVAPPSPPADDLTALVTQLRERWAKAGDDAVRRALVLRASEVRALWQRLRALLSTRADAAELVRRLDDLLLRSAAPASLDAVAALVPGADGLLGELAALAGSTPVAAKRGPGWQFWK